MSYLNQLFFLGLQLVISFLGKIPFEMIESLSKLFGGIWFSIDKKHKKIVLNNLSFAYRQNINKEIMSALARKVFDNTARMIFEYAWFYSAEDRYKSDHFRVKGIEHLTNAHKKKKGVLILSAHIGNWELATAITPLTGLPFTVVYRKIESIPIDILVCRNRKKIGLKLFPLHNAFNGVRQALNNGEIIGLLMDQNTGLSRGIFIDFFGRKTCANPGLAKLALETGAPVIPIFTYREKNKFIIEIQNELPLIRTGNETKDIFENTQLQNTTIEKIIRRYPDQWFWLHKRWKTRPLGEK